MYFDIQDVLLIIILILVIILLIKQNKIKEMLIQSNERILNIPISLTCEIGNQIWMSRNLEVTTFRNGDVITEARSDEEWEDATNRGEPAWCYYNYSWTVGEKYGKLYNWYAVNDPRGLPPEGFHIPTVDEWNSLFNYFGGIKEVGTIMKSKTGWPKDAWDNIERANTSGFGALPGGIKDFSGFSQQGSVGHWWSASEDILYKELLPCTFSLYDGYGSRGMTKEFVLKCSGLSVRCIKD